MDLGKFALVALFLSASTVGAAPPPYYVKVPLFLPEQEEANATSVIQLEMRRSDQYNVFLCGRVANSSQPAAAGLLVFSRGLWGPLDRAWKPVVRFSLESRSGTQTGEGVDLWVGGEGVSVHLTEATANKRSLCAGVGLVYANGWLEDSDFIVVVQTENLNRSGYALTNTFDAPRTQTADGLREVWRYSTGRGGSFHSGEMRDPASAETRTTIQGTPIWTQAGGVRRVEVTHGIYGSLGGRFYTEDRQGAYAVVGPHDVFAGPCLGAFCEPALAFSATWPAEAFAGGAGSYEFVNLASASATQRPLRAFWVDAPMPPGAGFERLGG